jgi:adenylate kinase
MAEKLGVPWISSGAVLREMAGRDERLARLVASGKLVPDPEVDRVILERLAGAGSGFVLDGYPRTVGQAESLLRFLQERSWRIDRVYVVVVPDEVVAQRLLSRDREDDRMEVVLERQRLYRQETEPAMQVLRDAGAEIVELDNSPPVEEVKGQLDASLRSLRPR